MSAVPVDGPDERFLFEYKAARALIAKGSNSFIAMLADGHIFFSDSEKPDFSSCPICKQFSATFLKDHKDKFLKVKACDYEFQVALADKLHQNGLTTPLNRSGMDAGIRLAAIAARDDLVCIHEKPTLFANLGAICHAGAVSHRDVEEYEGLH